MCPEYRVTYVSGRTARFTQPAQSPANAIAAGSNPSQKNGTLKKFEDVREAGAFTVRTGDVGKPYGV
jgi:hypothetical protein